MQNTVAEKSKHLNVARAAEMADGILLNMAIYSKLRYAYLANHNTRKNHNIEKWRTFIKTTVIEHFKLY